MQLAATIRGQGYRFGSVKEVLAKANAPKSGDDLAGISARDAVERVAARAVLARVPLTEAQADDPALQRQFARELEGAPRTGLRPVETQWREASSAQRREVDALLSKLEAA